MMNEPPKVETNVERQRSPDPSTTLVQPLDSSTGEHVQTLAILVDRLALPDAFG